MGFNLGAFAGAAGQSALGTYERLNEQAFRNLQREKLEQEMADQAALKGYLADAAQQKSYAGGQDVGQAIGQATNVYGDDLDTANKVKAIIADQPAAQQQQTLRALGGAEGAQTPTTTPGAIDLKNVGVYKNDAGQTMASTEGTAFTPAEQYKYALKQAQASGNTAAIKELLPLKNAMRESELADTWDKFKTENLSKLHRIAETGNTDAFIKEAKTHGVDVRVKQNKDGSQTLEHVQDGKVVNKYGSLQEAANAAGPALLNKLGAEHFGNAKDYSAYLNEREKIGIQKQEAGDKGMYYRAVANAYNTGTKGGGKGGANSAENQEKVLTMKADTLMKGDPKRFKDVDQAKAYIINSQLKGYDAEKNWAKIEEKLVGDRVPPNEVAAEKAAYLSRQGIAPEAAIVMAQSGVGPNGKPLTEADKQAFNRKYPNTYVEFGGPAASSPVSQPAAIPAPRYVPPEGSPVARSAERRQQALDLAEKDRVAFKTKIAETKAGAFNPTTQFEQDKGTMGPEALRAKYLPLQRALTPDQFDYLNQ